MFDNVGHGGADASAFDPKRYATLDGYAQDVIDICRRLQLAEIVLVAHSVSATIGSGGAARARALRETDHDRSFALLYGRWRLSRRVHPGVDIVATYDARRKWSDRGRNPGAACQADLLRWLVRQRGRCQLRRGIPRRRGSGKHQALDSPSSAETALLEFRETARGTRSFGHSGCGGTAPSSGIAERNVPVLNERGEIIAVEGIAREYHRSQAGQGRNNGNSTETLEERMRTRSESCGVLLCSARQCSHRLKLND